MSPIDGCRKCDIHTICPEHRAERDAANTAAATDAPLAFRKKNWRKGTKADGTALPTNKKKSRPKVKVEQCEVKAGRVRCQRESGHTGRHRARGKLRDRDGVEWTHEWRWDDRGRIEKEKWTEDRLFNLE